MGVNVRAVQVAAFTIGGALAGLSGALYAHQLRFRRGAVLQLAAVDLRAALRADRRHADRLGPAGRAACSSRSCRNCCASAGRGAMSCSASPIVADDGGPAGRHRHPRIWFAGCRPQLVARPPRRGAMEADAAALLSSTASPSVSAASPSATTSASTVPRRRADGADRAERRGQDDAVQPDFRRLPDRWRQHQLDGQPIHDAARRGARAARGWRARSRTSA